MESSALLNIEGIDYHKLKKLISKIDMNNLDTSWKIRKELYFIPLIVIAAKFKSVMVAKKIMIFWHQHHRF